MAVLYRDNDGDGYGTADATIEACGVVDGYASDFGDCDDTADTVNPGEDELCDGLDNDCDDEIDEDDAVDADTWFADGDGDGYGAGTDSAVACEAPEGFGIGDEDCDDTDDSINPGAIEECSDPIDRNCDGSVGFDDVDGDGVAACEDCDDTDDTVSDSIDWYADEDGDGFGDPLSIESSCDSPLGYVANDGDCDDSSASSNPEATETCDGLDNDCDEDVDEDAIDAFSWHPDADGDGYGDADTEAIESCMAIEDRVENGDDCDDSSADVSPEALEVCDGIDNDCNDAVDDADELITWYRDFDSDGYGDLSESAESCDPPEGYVADSADCNDADETIFPDAEEPCDEIDNNCDGEIDEEGTTTYYVDTDGDGFGTDDSAFDACAVDEGYAIIGGDCDDADDGVNPEAEETCDGIDNDCNDSVDDDATDALTYYVDGDADGWGDEDSSLESCSEPDGYVDASGDCDDSDESVNPDAVEVCNEVDDDCNGSADDDAFDAATWYLDADGDEFGVETDTLEACEQPDGYASEAGDCDDTELGVNPAETETCDGIDNDCDDEIDEASDITMYLDADGDGYGDPDESITGCEAPEGYVENGLDCDDTDPDISPEATEVCDDVDNDCDDEIDTDAEPLGADDSPIAWYVDEDGDGSGAEGTPIVACDQPDGYAATNDDCDDDDATIYPEAPELCDDIDNDCDAEVDEDAVSATVFYADVDGDGYGDEDTTDTSCSPPASYITIGGDCDDSDFSIRPDQDDTCDDIDNDCDGEIDEDPGLTWYEDLDGDGYGSDDSATDSCMAPDGFVVAGGDCDDDDLEISPDADEICDSIDNNCDGDTDGADATDALTWYLDLDGDGYGDPDGVSVVSCTVESADFVANDDDCNDDDDGVSPDEDEVCDGIDNDCDDEVDEDDATDAYTWYVDEDGDGYGVDTTVTAACDAPDGYSAYDSDCNDSDGDISPGATEACNETDDDCDGEIDEDATSSFYADGDGDGYGDPDTPADSCDAPDGYVEDASDCDDSDEAIHPGAEEVCDAKDNNCDGITDPSRTFYEDIDGDGYSAYGGLSMDGCSPDPGFAESMGDCDDSDPDINPDADEECDSVDNDCDGEVDEEGAIGWTIFHADVDEDGFGDPDDGYGACSPPTGYVEDDLDCNDNDASVYPEADEACDITDSDCDGSLTDDTFTDSDEDGIPDCVTGDTDGDGIGDVDELLLGTDPTLVDSDEDGRPDDEEIGDDVDSPTDSDGDGTIDALDEDDDGDGISSIAEDAGLAAPDGAGIDNRLDEDSDGDGVPDAEESTDDGDGDGIPAYLDADETTSSDTGSGSDTGSSDTGGSDTGTSDTGDGDD
jgi:hypothetical protein